MGYPPQMDARYVRGILSNPDVQPNAAVNRRAAAILLIDFKLVYVPADKHLGTDGLSQCASLFRAKATRKVTEKSGGCSRTASDPMDVPPGTSKIYFIVHDGRLWRRLGSWKGKSPLKRNEWSGLFVERKNVWGTVSHRLCGVRTQRPWHPRERVSLAAAVFVECNIAFAQSITRKFIDHVPEPSVCSRYRVPRTHRTGRANSETCWKMIEGAA